MQEDDQEDEDPKEKSSSKKDSRLQAQNQKSCRDWYRNILIDSETLKFECLESKIFFDNEEKNLIATSNEPGRASKLLE